MITTFLIMVGCGLFAAILDRWFTARQERLDRAQKHQHRMEVLRAEQALIEKTTDAIELLTLDPKFGEDFGARLRISLDKKAEKEAELEAEYGEEEAGEEEVQEAEQARRTHRR